MSMQEWIDEFAGKKVLIWGYGIEGKASYRFIRRILPEQELFIADGGKGYDVALEETVHTTCMKDQDLDLSQYDLILKAPGIVLAEGKYTPAITSETQLFLSHYAKQTIGITGTKGKSTTTSLVYALLSDKFDTVLVGNIGKACFDAIDEMEMGALAAFEISCHQLEYATVSPHVGVYLNLYQEHLDHYGSFEKYGDAKSHINIYQTKEDIAIMNEQLTQYIPHVQSKCVLIGKDIYAKGKQLFIPEGSLDVKECSLIGEHNYQNLAVAYYIANLYGISNEEVLDACRKFHPLHHRLEDIGVKDGIRYVNDSISTIGQACIQALVSIDHVDTVLVGGMDRGIAYDSLEDYLFKRKDVKVIFMYATGKRILQEMKEHGQNRDGLFYVDTLKEAVELAKKETAQGHTCLLSPAASSYDSFKNFEERGRIFTELTVGVSQ